MASLDDLLNQMKQQNETGTDETITDETITDKTLTDDDKETSVEVISEEERTLRQLFGEIDETMQEVEADIVGIQYADRVSYLPDDDKNKKWAILNIEYQPQAIPGIELPKQKGTISLSGVKDLTPDIGFDKKHEYEVDEKKLKNLNQQIAYVFNDLDIVDFDTMFKVLSDMFKQGKTIHKKVYIKSFIDSKNKGKVHTKFSLLNRSKNFGEFIETTPITRDLMRFVTTNSISNEKDIIEVVIDKIKNNNFSGEDKNGEKFQYGQLEIIFHISDKHSDEKDYEKFENKHYLSKYKYLNEDKEIDYFKFVEQVNTVAMLLGLTPDKDINITLQKLENLENVPVKMEFQTSQGTYNYGPLKGQNVIFAKLV